MRKRLSQKLKPPQTWNLCPKRRPMLIRPIKTRLVKLSRTDVVNELGAKTNLSINKSGLWTNPLFQPLRKRHGEPVRSCPREQLIARNTHHLYAHKPQRIRTLGIIAAIPMRSMVHTPVVFDIELHIPPVKIGAEVALGRKPSRRLCESHFFVEGRLWKPVSSERIGQ